MSNDVRFQALINFLAAAAIPPARGRSVSIFCDAEGRRRSAHPYGQGGWCTVYMINGLTLQTRWSGWTMVKNNTRDPTNPELKG